MARQLETIQENDRLTEVWAMDEPGPGNASHLYRVRFHYETPDLMGYSQVDIPFQKGPRNEPNSKPGITDADLLEIVRDRLIGFQEGEYACRENAIALTHIEDALLWLNRRVQVRKAKGILGKNEK